MAPEPDLSRSFELGPYLQAAFICEQVIEEKSGVLSFIRVIDRLTHAVPRPEAPEEMMPFVYNLCLVVMLKTGENPGNFRVGVQPIRPSNERLPMFVNTVNLEATAERGANLVVRVSFPFDMTGLWWFDVTLNEVRVTRIPLRVIYLPQPILGPT